MRRVMRGGDLRGYADLKPFAKTPRLYALGPLEGLRGEVTIFDGTPYISRVQGGKPVVGQTFAAKACFLVYAQVTDWQQVPIPSDVETLSDLERFIARAAAVSGVGKSAPFPFLLTNTPRRADCHIVHKTDNKPHSHAEHDRIKVMFSVADKPVKIVGFWSDKHAGVFTHHDSTVHLHLVTADGKSAGHLDELQLAPGGVLSLPRPQL